MNNSRTRTRTRTRPVTGYDAGGRPSPLEPADTTVTATMAKGSGVIHFTVGRERAG